MEPVAVGVGVVAVAAAVAGVIMARAARQRALFDRLLGQRGWARSRDGETTTISPHTGEWAVRMTRSFASQQLPTTHIVTSVWTAASPLNLDGTLIAGPTPPAPLRDLAVGLIGTVNPKVGGWLGLNHVEAGAPWQQVASADPRLLVLASDGIGPVGTLSGVADAVARWCSNYGGDREQPAVVIDSAGVSVRVRMDVLQSAAHLMAFVELGEQCRGALAGSTT